MNSFFLFARLPVLGWLLAVAGPAAAQCVLTPLPAGCTTPFVAVDVATGQPVDALCVGRAVRFEPACGRSVAANLLYYNALPGTSITPANCDFVPGQLAANTFLPAAAGPISVSELANPSVAGGTGTVFVRNFQVYASPAPITTLIPCLHNAVGLTITTSGYDQYFAQVDAGALVGPLGPGTITLPAAPGSSITVIGRYLSNGLCEGQATKIVPTPTPAQTPVLSRLTTQGPLPTSNIILVVSNLPNDYYYRVERLDASGPHLVMLLSPNSTSGVVINPYSLPGQYRIGRVDYCRTDSAFSALVPTIELAGTSTNNVNNLSWQTAGPVDGYTLLRDGNALATLPPSATTYIDAAVSCGTSYTYQLQATVAGSQSISNEVAVLATSTLPPSPPLLNASFDLLGRLTLTASGPGGAALPAGGQLLYSRQGGPGALDFAAVPTATDTLRDPANLAALLAAPPCYRVRLQDVCSNSSAPTPPTCPSLLAVAAADPEGLTAQLNWSAFQGPGSPAAPASYRVLTLAPDGTVLAASAPTAGLSYLDPTPPPDRQVLRYRLEVSGAGLPPGTVSYSNVATLARRPRLLVPNAFTPNGDGLNDVLELKGRYLNSFSFVILDRNGQEVFRATDRTQTWDGTIRGHAPVNAAYVWHLQMLDETGQDFSQTGTVTILK